MDKTTLLLLLAESGKARDKAREGGWAGSCDQKAPPPFGRTSLAGLHAFNVKALEELEAKPLQRSAVACAARARGSTYSPMHEYERELAKTDGDKLARALARGCASGLAGCTIGERQLVHRRRPRPDNPDDVHELFRAHNGAG